jgi:mannose-6-phosphate isomerase-like protein (cupin superfamily)
LFSDEKRKWNERGDPKTFNLRRSPYDFGSRRDLLSWCAPAKVGRRDHAYVAGEVARQRVHTCAGEAARPNCRVPGEFTHRLTGDEYGFESLSFIISETHPGGGPGLHVHDTEEAHVLLKGTAQYRIGDKTFTVQGPYVAKVPAGVPHTFINAGSEPFNLIAVFASKHPNTKRIGQNPLIPVRENREEPRDGPVP